MYIFRVAVTKTFLGFVLSVLLGVPLSLMGQPSAGSSKQVLAIYGTGGVATWEQTFNAAFFNDLGADSTIHVDPEFLSLVQASEEDQELYAQSLQLKYRTRDFNLVLAILPEANDFVVKYKPLFAPTADVIHVLPDSTRINSSTIKPRTAIMQTSAGIAVEKTVALIPALLPRLERAYVVGGAGAGDTFYLNHFREAISKQVLEFDVVYLQGLTPQELLDELSSERGNAAILMATYDLDRLGTPQRTLMMTKLLREKLVMPVFGFIDTLPPNGSIGGNMAVTENYAHTAAELTQNALTGVFPDRSVTAETNYVFNGAELDKFGINRKLLPEGSTIINDTPTLWRQYYLQVISASVVIALLVSVVALLLNAIRMRKSAEQELLKAHKREALGHLASGVAHDFNNILMSISANTELAGFETTDASVKEKLNKIMAASNRAKNLVKQILMFSRPAVSEAFVTIELRRYLKDTIGQLDALFGDKHTIKYKPGNDTLYISVDPTELHQVVMNVCINAQQAMPNGGAVEIFTSKVKVTEPRFALNQKIPNGDYVKVDFKDSGLGIPHENISKVFEPFFTTKSKGEGTGLGLALVIDIVNRHHAFLNIHSKPDQGTEISIYFPEADSPNPTAGTALVETLIKGNGETVLLVEDDEMVRVANKRLLEVLNYTVVDYGDPQEALQYVENKQHNIAIVLSDFSMPHMDGAQLIGKIREIDSALPVVLYTGYLNDLAGRRIPNCQVLQKPIKVADLSQALHASLKQSV